MSGTHLRGQRDDPVLGPLNPAQREATQIIRGPLLVLAGAGSGKTRVITHRIAWMIREGVDPATILAVTFTNKAAREMRERVRRLTGTHEVRLSTFHSFCASFLREELPAIGRSGDFSIYDDGDGLALVKRVLSELSLDPTHMKPERVLGRIGRWKNALVLPEDLAGDETGAVEAAWVDAYRRYDAALAEANACDFDDLLVRALLILRDDPEVAARWRQRIRYVLVDEFQDTNPVQYGLVRHLTAGDRNLCVTGDQDQSIYSWRGADPVNFDRFLEDHPEAPVVRLEQNYRSTGNILKAASEVISHNRYRIPKTLWSDAEEGEPVRVVGFTDDYEEAASLARAVREFETEGYPRDQMAVCFRTNALSLPIERALIQDGIRYAVVGGLEFFARVEVKDLMANLRFLANPRDTVSLSRILNVPPRGIGPKTRSEVFEMARSSARSPGELLRIPKSFSGMSPRARKALETFADILSILDEERGEPVTRQIRTVLEATGYGEHWKQKATRSGSLDPYQNLGQVVSLAQEFDALHGEGLPAFLNHVALMTDQDRSDPEEGSVSLMTLHTSKGLEFDVVFLVGVEQGVLPHVMSSDSPEGLEEERRLLHVGMTRARRRLVITWAGSRTRFGRRQPAIPSHFLDEVGEDGVERFGDPVSRFARDPSGDAADDWEDEAHPLAHVRKGAPVWHPDWGTGRVVALRGHAKGLDRKVVVAFEGDVQRTLILRHSGLEIVDDGAM